MLGEHLGLDQGLGPTTCPTSLLCKRYLVAWGGALRRRLAGTLIGIPGIVIAISQECQDFEIFFALLSRLDDATAEDILFAEECGSWMVGIEWTRVLPAWFRVLAVTTEPTEHARRVEAINQPPFPRPRSRNGRGWRRSRSLGPAESNPRALINSNRPDHASALGAEVLIFEESC